MATLIIHLSESVCQCSIKNGLSLNGHPVPENTTLSFSSTLFLNTSFFVSLTRHKPPSYNASFSGFLSACCIDMELSDLQKKLREMNTNMEIACKDNVWSYSCLKIRGIYTHYYLLSMYIACVVLSVKSTFKVTLSSIYVIFPDQVRQRWIPTIINAVFPHVHVRLTPMSYSQAFVYPYLRSLTGYSLSVQCSLNDVLVTIYSDSGSSASMRVPDFGMTCLSKKLSDFFVDYYRYLNLSKQNVVSFFYNDIMARYDQTSIVLPLFLGKTIRFFCFKRQYIMNILQSSIEYFSKCLSLLISKYVPAGQVISNVFIKGIEMYPSFYISIISKLVHPSVMIHPVFIPFGDNNSTNMKFGVDSTFKPPVYQQFMENYKESEKAEMMKRKLHMKIQNSIDQLKEVSNNQPRTERVTSELRGLYCNRGQDSVVPPPIDLTDGKIDAVDFLITSNTASCSVNKKKNESVTLPQAKEKSVDSLPSFSPMNQKKNESVSLPQAKEKSVDSLPSFSPMNQKKNESVSLPQAKEKDSDSLPSFSPMNQKSNESNASVTLPQAKEKSVDSLPSFSPMNQKNNNNNASVSLPQTKEKSSDSLPSFSPMNQKKSESNASVTLPQAKEKNSDSLPSFSPMNQKKSESNASVTLPQAKEKNSDSLPSFSPMNQKKSESNASVSLPQAKETIVDSLPSFSPMNQKKNASVSLPQAKETIVNSLPSFSPMNQKNKNNNASVTLPLNSSNQKTLPLLTQDPATVEESSSHESSSSNTHSEEIHTVFHRKREIIDLDTPPSKKPNTPYSLKEDGLHWEDLIISGELCDGKPDGYCITRNKNNQLVAQGNYENCLLEGVSVFYYSMDLSVIVNMRKGVCAGKAVFFRGEEVIGRGEFVDGLLTGKGFLPFQDIIVIGTFVKNKMWGDCTIFRNEKLCFMGSFVNGVREGPGREYEDSTVVYQGNYHNNKRDGRGTLVLPDKSVYKGEFCKDSIHGYGILIDKNAATIYQGRFVNNTYNGIPISVQ